MTIGYNKARNTGGRVLVFIQVKINVTAAFRLGKLNSHLLLGKRCLFGLLGVSFSNVYQCVSVCLSFPFGFEGGMWDLIALVPLCTLSSSHCM